MCSFQNCLKMLWAAGRRNSLFFNPESQGVGWVAVFLVMWEHPGNMFNLFSPFPAVLGSRRHRQLSDRPWWGHHCFLLVSIFALFMSVCNRKVSSLLSRLLSPISALSPLCSLVVPAFVFLPCVQKPSEWLLGLSSIQLKAFGRKIFKLQSLCKICQDFREKGISCDA